LAAGLATGFRLRVAIISLSNRRLGAAAAEAVLKGSYPLRSRSDLAGQLRHPGGQV
jgi:hypothetical protein